MQTLSSSITEPMPPHVERDVPPRPRTTIASDEPGRFELVGELARGGMGRIMEAWDPRHERRVAIKMLLQTSDEAARRFAREARITGRLQHPAIVPLYEAGRTPGGEPFYAMKLVDGKSLGAAMLECGSLEERLALLPNLVAVSDAIAYAHTRRIIHRDLKPSNVLIGAFGETIVIDWGLAKDLAAREDDATIAELTRGRPIGTPRYMPPEQARGEPTDERSDVYALGALLYHLLGGAAPYRELSARQVLEQVRTRSPIPLASLEPRLPRALVAIVARAMARDPKKRYATARELSDDLKRFTAGQLASPARALEKKRGATQRGVLALAALVLCALVIGAVLLLTVVAKERARNAASPAIEAAAARAAVALLSEALTWNS
jgi:serine/threonine protein kinase